MIKSWSDDAWDDFCYWQKQDKKTLKRILALIKDIDRNSYKGIGKPEPLREDLSGYWSWRIDEANILHVDEQYHETQKAACPSRMMRNGQAALS